MWYPRFTFSNHALVRMFERSISFPEVVEAARNGLAAEEYPNDAPYPSRLLVGWCSGRCLHVLVADNETGETIVITVYDPDPGKWEPPEFTRRKPQA